MILPQLRAAVLASFPGIDAPKKAFFRIVRNVAARVNLQAMAPTSDQTTDLANVEVCPGVPGVTSDPTPGETVIVMLVGKDEVPYVVGRAAENMPGHVPAEVRHDATSAIRFVSKSASAGAKVYVGSATFPLARSADLDALLTALDGAATTMIGSGVPDVVAVGNTLQAALSGLTVTPTAKLEAE